MSESLATELEALSALIRQETALLQAGDLHRAAAGARAKASAIAALAASSKGITPSRALAAKIDALREAAEANRDALDGAIRLQARVVEVVVRAAARASQDNGPGYARIPGTGSVPIALSMRT
jgi:hypothetical protein